MMDHYYKFQDRQTMLDALQPLGMTYEDSEGNQQVSQGGHQYAAWEVGEIGGLEGWHLNLRQIDDNLDLSALEQYIVHPTAPRCVWA